MTTESPTSNLIYIPVIENWNDKVRAENYSNVPPEVSHNKLAAIHSLISTLVKCEKIYIEDSYYFKWRSGCQDYYQEIFDKINIETNANNSSIIKELCQYVKTEDDLNEVLDVFGSGFKSSEAGWTYKIHTSLLM